MALGLMAVAGEVDVATTDGEARRIGVWKPMTNLS
jgi:hypothetical protein